MNKNRNPIIATFQNKSRPREETTSKVNHDALKLLSCAVICVEPCNLKCRLQKSSPRKSDREKLTIQTTRTFVVATENTNSHALKMVALCCHWSGTRQSHKPPTKIVSPVLAPNCVPLKKTQNISTNQIDACKRPNPCHTLAIVTQLSIVAPEEHGRNKKKFRQPKRQK